MRCPCTTPFSTTSCYQSDGNTTSQHDETHVTPTQHGKQNLSALGRRQVESPSEFREVSRSSPNSNTASWEEINEGNATTVQHSGRPMDNSERTDSGIPQQAAPIVGTEHRFETTSSDAAEDNSTGDAHQMPDYDERRPPDLVRRVGVQPVSKVRKEFGLLGHEQGTMHSYAERWANEFLDSGHLQKKWSQAAMWLLQNKPSRVPEFLLKTHGLLEVEQAWIGAVIRSLGQYCASQEDYVARPIVAALAEALQVLVHRPNQPPLRLHAKDIRNLLPRLALGEVQRIYGFMKDGTLDVSWREYLQLCRYFAEEGDVAQAVDAFVACISEPNPGNQVRIRMTLLFLVKWLGLRSDGYRQSFRLLENIQRFGIQIDTGIVNSLMQIAYAQEQYQAAIDLYHTSFAEHLEPDATTFALLCQIFEADSDTDLTIEHMIDEAFRTGVIYHNQVIANQILHLFSLSALKVPETAWLRISSMYGRLFDGDALQLLDLPVDEHLELDATMQRQSPTHVSINIVLKAYLKLHAEGFLQESDTVDVYQKWHSFVLQGKEPFLRMALDDYTYNLFLFRFTRERETLINATAVMKDMQTPLPSSMGVEKSKPTVQSWNIFLLGFQRHNKQQLADQVLQHMENEGIEQDEVTWNILVNGHAGRQDLEKLVHALRSASDTGMQFDAYTERGLSKFNDQAKLHDALKESRYRDELDFSQELKTGIGAKLQANDG
ncbi:hypothetical protein AMS68_002965 [Peltaster fructicola]|uniref:Pentacotripeptide-repeat region of PRORP domain-containing protein n=1 Tax=Peltaster fructicola TaxID=286661 RepID=A0A6H0XS46_9PEZI|nr:hypothetical protein AMS68_002965 [Peltaster fructicola]